MTKFIRFFVVCLIVGLGSSSVSGGFNTGNSDIDLAGLNRDIDNVQEITKDEITGALDGRVTIDNRVLTESGRDQIADQHEIAGQAIADVAVYVGDQAASVALAAIEAIDNLVGEDSQEKAERLFTDILTPKNASKEDIAKVANALNTAESQNVIAVMAEFNDDKSVTENIQDMLKSNPELFDDTTRQQLTDLIKLGADDNNLLGTMLRPMYHTMVDAGVTNPMNTLSDAFGFSIEERDVIATVAGLPRSTEYGGCNTAGCGDIGASRGGRTHKGQDINAESGDLVFAPIDGKVSDTNAPYKTDNGDLSIVTIKNENDESRSFYTDPRDGISVGSTVEQGDVVGTVQDLQKESPNRHGNSKDPAGITPNHSHQEYYESGNRNTVKPSDPSDIIFPNRR